MGQHHHIQSTVPLISNSPLCQSPLIGGTFSRWWLKMDQGLVTFILQDGWQARLNQDGRLYYLEWVWWWVLYLRKNNYGFYCDSHKTWYKETSFDTKKKPSYALFLDYTVMDWIRLKIAMWIEDCYLLNIAMWIIEEYYLLKLAMWIEDCYLLKIAMWIEYCYLLKIALSSVHCEFKTTIYWRYQCEMKSTIYWR